MRCLDRAIYSDQLTLKSNIHNVHVDIYGVLIVAIGRSSFLISFLLGGTGVLLGVIHLELCLIPLLGASDPTFLHLLLSSATIIQTSNEASVVLMTFPPVIHLGLGQIILAMASVDHGRTQHAVEVFLIQAHVVVCDRPLSVKAVLHFLTLNLLGSQHRTVARTLLRCNIISRAEAFFRVLTIRSALSNELSHVRVHVHNAAVLIWSSWNAILSFGVGGTRSHVVIISEDAIILNSLLHIFLGVLILHVLRHR